MLLRIGVGVCVHFTDAWLRLEKSVLCHPPSRPPVIPRRVRSYLEPETGEGARQSY